MQAADVQKNIEKDNSEFGDFKTKEECLANGGVWQRWGLLPEEYCQIPAKDGDKPCTDGSECSLGTCLSFEKKIPGRCKQFRHMAGCWNVINQGKIESGFCVD